jgi:hypothetical protein
MQPLSVSVGDSNAQSVVLSVLRGSPSAHSRLLTWLEQASTFQSNQYPTQQQPGLREEASWSSSTGHDDVARKRAATQIDLVAERGVMMPMPEHPMRAQTPITPPSIPIPLVVKTASGRRASPPIAIPVPATYRPHYVVFRSKFQTRMCNNFMREGTCRRSRCFFAHGERELLRDPHEYFVPSIRRVCWEFAIHGFCMHGRKCTKDHVVNKDWRLLKTGVTFCVPENNPATETAVRAHPNGHAIQSAAYANAIARPGPALPPWGCMWIPVPMPMVANAANAARQAPACACDQHAQ